MFLQKKNIRLRRAGETMTRNEYNRQHGKRYRIASRAKFTISMAIVILMSIFIITTLAGFNDVSGSTVDKFEYRTVYAGETLWSIASDYNDGSEDIRQTIYDICQANDVTAETLAAGQELVIPL